MSLTPEQFQFVQDHRAAAMITMGGDGLPKPVRIAYQVIDGEIWSSGTQYRVRTTRLREDPRCTLFIWDPVFDFLSIHTTVEVLEGPEAPEINLKYFRQLLGAPEGPITWGGVEYDGDESFKQKMIDDQRLIYRFTPLKAFGNK